MIKKCSITNNVMPSAVAETKELYGITITCNGNGTYTVSGTATANVEISFIIPEFTIPISVGQGGNGTLSFFNTFYNTNNKLVIKFMNGATLVDSWSLNTPNRTHTTYSILGGKRCNKIALSASTGMVCNGEFAIMFTNDGQLPAEFVPHLIWNRIPYRQYHLNATSLTSDEITTDGSNLNSLTISGNTIQNGTPSPTNIIYPIECGERTKNLCEYHLDVIIGSGGVISTSGAYQTYFAPVIAGQSYSVSSNVDVYAYYNSKPVNGSIAIDNDRHYPNTTDYIITIPEGCTWLGIRVQTGNIPMLNEGSTALPYEPYGQYKIPITINSNTYNIYLNEPIRKIGNYSDTINNDGSVNRIIYKKVLTGTETWYTISTGDTRYFQNRVGTINTLVNTLVICSHFENKPISDATTNIGAYVYNSTGTGYSVLNIRPYDVSSTSDTAFKQFLATEYANGTPVTVYYILQTPTTEQTTMPTIPTNTGENTLTIDTTLQPSDVKIADWWENKGYGKYYDEQRWINALYGKYSVGYWENFTISEMEQRTINQLQGG